MDVNVYACKGSGATSLGGEESGYIESLEIVLFGLKVDIFHLTFKMFL